MKREDRKRNFARIFCLVLLAFLLGGMGQDCVWAETGDTGQTEETQADGPEEEDVTGQAPEETQPLEAENRVLTIGWIQEGGTWYYYNSNGKLHTGWLEENGSWYYLEEDGRMAVGWRYMKEQWYYFSTSGVMVAEQWAGDYYLTASGAMAVNAWIGKYYVGSDGRWIPGYSQAQWMQEGERWWYRNADGTYPKSCWKTISGSAYYFNEAGWLVTGWLKDQGKWYYLTEYGMKKNEWMSDGKTWYYLTGDGSMAVGWVMTGGAWYYMNSNGVMQTGWQQIQKEWYYLKENGVMQTGWLFQGKSWYYLKSSGAMATSWQQVGKTWYYLSGSGVMQTGWQRIGRAWYYLKTEGAMQTGWLLQGQIWYYLKGSGAMATGWQKVGSTWYYFYGSGAMAVNTCIDGYLINRKGEYYEPALGTIKGLLQNAMVPVGSTMYVYGGGWDEDATRKGPSPQWKKFYEKQNSSYDYNTTRYQSENGLDCSGFVGWSVYNALNKVSGKSSCTVTSTAMVSNYASRGWGTKIDRSKVKDYRAGDVMGSTCGCHNHVYLVIGQCSDGSVVFVHSSPKGVQINGTTTPSGSYSSKAISLANSYMKKYFPDWNKKFGNSSGPQYYLSHFSQMRWDISGNKVMRDPEGYTKKSAEQVLKDLFEE
ncbi:hypothetical protein GKG47_04625 [Lactonifactor sp. BIOML-A3]|uniref:N-acetylmuramoyl-L-alanine amidase family protein n=1 Tax=Lactonifactor sp. BIOML-A3 TaxID=2584656 RepID=UPI0012B0DCB0|nr:N-acetylmuramoyl-L-alanine amidase family protein [Lactonifactor sp. BIOML-A3]MSA11729.1 hypothetical protein [Lactonifactor sp. BIOML-A3]